MTLSKSEVRVGDAVIAHPAEPSDDLAIEPLAAATRQIQAAHEDKPEGFSPLWVIRADPATPYRLLVRVLYTLFRSGAGGYRLTTLPDVTAAGGGGHAAEPLGAAGPVEPLAGAAEPSPTDSGDGKPSGHLVVHISNGGFAVRFAGDTLAPGCAAPAGDEAVMTVPAKGGEHDTAGLERCAQRVKESSTDSTDVVISAERATPYREVLAAMAALRGLEGELFPKVRFGFRRTW